MKFIKTRFLFGRTGLTKVKYLALLFVPIMCLSAIWVDFASANSYNLTGTVTDSSGNSISGATVSVSDANSDSTITDRPVAIL